MNKKKILFVDDEANILSGLKRMLHSMRKEFDFKFAESGKEALELMSDTTFDLVISDMRMPGMDGATLLTEIQKRHPYSIRIMLTGQADEESVLRTVGVAHQFLAKPCETEHLKEVLLRASALHDLISQDALKQIVSQLDTLPSVPEVYARLRKAMADPDISMADVAEIIEEDMAMSAKVLQLVNSAFFGLFQKVESPSRAVNLLGLDTVKNLVLGVGAFSEIKASSTVFSVKKLWAHSMMVGTLAKKIAMSESDDKELIDNCFIAGLLHDIGKLVLLAQMGEKYEQAVLLAKERQVSLCTAEKEIFDTVHGDIGAYLMGLWGMPGAVVEAIGFHHRLEDYPNEKFNPAIAVHTANAFYYENRPDEITGAPHGIAMAHLQSLSLGDTIDHWRNLCAESFEQDSKDD
ncbi:MAG: HDOD domain-containing protein [Proteobacteria bacterium]|nr:HDOD domain-containing protein [Pseudomonadota bacterium]MBU1059139.1 HDOD domain-containing protein [Pseudomonadota bacterium]